MTQAKKKKTDKSNLQAEREAFKADIRKGIKKFEVIDSEEDEVPPMEEPQELDKKRLKVLVDLGYPLDYIVTTLEQNCANYCLSAYYLLGID